MRKFLMAGCLLAIPVMAAAQDLGWRKYTVPETGANLELPLGLFSKDAGQAEDGYGRSFTTDDGRANVTVQSIANSTNDSPAAFLARKHPPPGIVYKRVTSRFFVVSSFRKDKIWYNRCNFGGDHVHCVLVNYPAVEKRQWDGIVTRISNTLASR